MTEHFALPTLYECKTTWVYCIIIFGDLYTGVGIDHVIELGSYFTALSFSYSAFK